MYERDPLTEIKLLNSEPIDETHYVAPRLAPETYPGEFPDALGSLIVGHELFDMTFDEDSDQFVVNSEDGQVSLDAFLASKNLPGMVDRFPMTVFGSNRCPGQLLDKFEKAQEGVDEDLTVVPMATGTMKGFDVVYNAKAGNLGYFFADLYQGPETRQTEIEVNVLFVTKEQLRIINDSEKAYDYTMLGEVNLGRKPGDDSKPYSVLPAYAYVGKAEVYSHKVDGKHQPVAISEIKAVSRNLQAFSQPAFQDYFFSVDPAGAKQHALQEVSGDSEIEPKGKSYRDHMKAKWAGGIHELSERKAFQENLVAATSKDERQLIDPSTFEVALTKVKPEDILPQFGHIAVINWLTGGIR